MEKELGPGTEQRYIMMFTDKVKEKETCPLPAGLFNNIPYQLSVLYIIKGGQVRNINKPAERSR